MKNKKLIKKLKKLPKDAEVFLAVGSPNNRCKCCGPVLDPSEGLCFSVQLVTQPDGRETIELAAVDDT